jgi:hypothetical protein
MVYLRNALCSRWVLGRCTEKKAGDGTYGTPLVCDTTGIHREVEELLPFWVPAQSPNMRRQKEKRELRQDTAHKLNGNALRVEEVDTYDEKSGRATRLT